MVILFTSFSTGSFVSYRLLDILKSSRNQRFLHEEARATNVHQLTESPDSASQQEQHKNATRPRGLDLLSAHNRSRYARDASLHRCIKGIKRQYDSCRGRHVDIVECLNEHVFCLVVGVVPPTCEPVYGYPYSITSCPMIVENCKCA